MNNTHISRWLALMLNMVVFTAAAQQAGSQHIALPGDGLPSFGALRTAEAGDSTSVRAVAGSACPAGQFWAHDWGVASCLQAHQVCNASIVQWQAGDFICQAQAPAGAALRHVVTYLPRSDGRLRESYTLQVAEPTAVATRADISPSHGYATVTCVAGSWVLTASVCGP